VDNNPEVRLEEDREYTSKNSALPMARTLQSASVQDSSGIGPRIGLDRPADLGERALAREAIVPYLSVS